MSKYYNKKSNSVFVPIFFIFLFAFVFFLLSLSLFVTYKDLVENQDKTKNNEPFVSELNKTEYYKIKLISMQYEDGKIPVGTFAVCYR